jgi:small ligand-binding sensory domain FIST
MANGRGRELCGNAFDASDLARFLAAQTLSTTQGDPGIRRVMGVVSSAGDIEIYIDGKPGRVKGHKLKDATLDAK